jgi:hypothetical protein
VTLVSGITPESAVTSLGADSVGYVRGIDALYERAVEDQGGGYDPSRPVIGVADIGGEWSLVAEINGFVGSPSVLSGRCPLAERSCRTSAISTR